MELPEIPKIHELLAAKDDTSRFVGLLLLKAVLDKHASDLQHEQVSALWDSISPRFLDRLIRTGSRPTSEQRKQSGDMLDVAVAVIYTFTKLLNDCAVSEKFYARIPNLTKAVLYSSKETTQRIVDLIHVLVQQPDDQINGGATCFAGLDLSSWEPLIEIAPLHEAVFSIFHWAWVKGGSTTSQDALRAKIDDAFPLFISSFKGHNPIPLLDFITLIFNNLDPNLRPLDPQWLRSVARWMQDMTSNRQTEDSRRAYTHSAAALLATYPEKAPESLFSDDPNSPRPVAYLFVKMVQVDILSTLHVLIPKSNTPEYASLSRRIAAALDIMTSFVGFLIAAADDPAAQHGLTPDRIIKLHEDLIRTIGDVMEYLRDRWDEFLASSRSIESAQPSGNIFQDPITPAAVRFVATWLRDDDGESLRKQAAGLIEMFAELYKMNATSADEIPELRLPILAALEGVLQTPDGREAFNNTDLLTRGLYPDLRALLADQDGYLAASDYIRGSAIIGIFHILLEHDESTRPHAGTDDLLEAISKYDIKTIKGETVPSDRLRLDFQTDLLELAAELLDRSSRSVSALARQQNIKAAMKDMAAKVIDNWRVLDDEDMASRVVELQFE